MESKQMPAASPDIITQEQLRIGTDLIENVSMATRICKIYMQELQRRVAGGVIIEPGPLTFRLEHMSVCHTYC
jgi:hypothetical protein